jgi:spore maturation protein B
MAALKIILSIALFKRVKVYEKFVEGAKEGFQVGVRIIPYLVAMLVAIAMFRTSGALDILTWILRPVTELVGMPPEVLPMALMRPLSGSGSIGVMTELMKTYGPDSLIGFIASTMFGSSETTFYVIAVYFGSINVQKTRYALPAGLTADAIGLIMASLICRAFF